MSSWLRVNTMPRLGPDLAVLRPLQAAVCRQACWVVSVLQVVLVGWAPEDPHMRALGVQSLPLLLAMLRPLQAAV